MRAPASPAGFTLVELLVVMSIMLILVGIALPQYSSTVRFAKEAVLKEDLFRMRDAIDQYDADKGQYPASIEALASQHYIRKVPVDPITREAWSWESIPADFDPGSPATPGVYDIKSGADRTALDGSSYRSW